MGEDFQRMYDYLDKFRSDLNGTLKDFKADLIRELGGRDKVVDESMNAIKLAVTDVKDDLEKLDGRVAILERASKRWPTSAVSVVSILAASCVGLLYEVGSLLLR
jgi:hypothetical protein